MVVNKTSQSRLSERYNIYMKKKQTLTEEVVHAASSAVDGVSEVVSKTESKVEEVVAPVRKHVIKRFPVLFLLLVTFGLTATITGIEQILLKFDLLQSHPSVVLVIGLATLVLTGTLYKKLG